MPGGEQFRRLTQLSAQGIPSICVVFGSSTAGGAYLPGMSDYTVMVEDRARVFLGGPPLVKMAIGEDADEEELGGALMHARTSGLCDYLARDEPEAIRIARGIVAHLHWRRLGPAPAGPADEPLYPAEELLGIASVDVRVPFDVREVLARVLDGSRLEEFKESYGAQLVCGWGVPRRLPDRRGGQQRHPVLARGTEGRPVHCAVQPDGHADPVRPEHHGLHGGHARRAGRDHQGRRQADQRRLQLERAAPDADGRRQLRGRELRHGGPGLRPPLHLHLAEPPHRRHGTQAAGRRPLHRAPQRRRGGGPAVRRGGRRGAAPGHREPDRGGVNGAVRHRPVVGRRDHRPADTRTVLAIALAGCTRPRCRGRRSSGWCGTDGTGGAPDPSCPRRQPWRNRPAPDQGRPRRRPRGDRRLRGGRRRRPARRRGRRGRPAPRCDARGDLPRPGGAGPRRGGCGRRRPPPRLRLPLRESRPARGLRPGRHRMGGATSRSDARHGPQGAGEGGRGPGGRPRAPECRVAAGATPRSWRPPRSASATPSWSRRPPGEGGAACASCPVRATWPTR